MDPIYIFHHIPRCGGTSCKQALRQWFKIVGDYRGDWSEESTKFFVEHPKDLTHLTPDDLLTGHFELPGAFIEERYPEILENDHYRLITFIRDPLDVALSVYWYMVANEQSHNSPYFNPDPEKSISGQQNFISNILRCTSENFKEVLSRYWFVGLFEDLQGSLDLLARKIGRTPVQLPHLNQASKECELSKDARNAFFRKNALDFEIYEYCRQSYAENKQKIYA